jgi:hypothetical protein
MWIAFCVDGIGCFLRRGFCLASFLFFAFATATCLFHYARFFNKYNQMVSCISSVFDYIPYMGRLRYSARMLALALCGVCLLRAVAQEDRRSGQADHNFVVAEKDKLKAKLNFLLIQ